MQSCHAGGAATLLHATLALANADHPAHLDRICTGTAAASNSGMKRVVMGIVDTPLAADATVRGLNAASFGPREISVLYCDRHGDHDFGFEASTKAPEGALMGIGFGAVIGAMVGLAVGFAGLLPALLALAEWGPVLTALSGAAIGALVLGVIGGAIGAVTPEIEAKYYDGKTRSGAILVAVHANDRDEVRRARAVFGSVAASDVHAMGEAAVPLAARA